MFEDVVKQMPEDRQIDMASLLRISPSPAPIRKCLYFRSGPSVTWTRSPVLIHLAYASFTCIAVVFR